jgi:SAM-dependent methyltransferase
VADAGRAQADGGGRYGDGVVIARGMRSLKLRVLDAADRASGRADPLIPPRRLMDFVGDSDFRETGEAFMRLFVELGGLAPHHRVLDVGCGIGRMARPLTSFLQPPGAYEGFDIVPEAIAWCGRRYAEYPHFRFRVADVSNGLYRPGAGVPASEYKFPYPADSFDFAFATSLFTHLLPAESDRYLSELARVTRPGGRVFLTFFLLSPERRPSESGGRFSFPNDYGHFATTSKERPEAAVAYDESWLHTRLAAIPLELAGPIHYGSWNGRGGVTLLDVVIAERSRPV